LIAFGALIGIPAAFVAALFLAAVHGLQQWLWHDLAGGGSPAWYWVLGLPIVGALIVLGARRLLPGDGGHDPLRGLDPSPTPIRDLPGVVLAALGTLGFGAVLGPEGPIIAIGSVVGEAVTSWAKVRDKDRKIVSNAGQFSAVSALFGGPVVAGMLLLETGLAMGRALLPALLPGLVSAAVGYVIFIGLGSWGGLKTAGLTVPDLPDYRGTHIYDLLIAIVVGVAAALVIFVAKRMAGRVVALRERFGMVALLLAGALAVGVIAEVGDLLGANSQDILFSGQSSIGVLVGGASFKILVILLVAKLLGYAVSLGCGFRGGPIFPAIFLGIALASFAVCWFHTSPTLAVAIGAAAGMAAEARLLFSPLILMLVLVGAPGRDATPAAVLASAAAWLTVRVLSGDAEAEPAPAPADDGPVR
jgi:H+/Cl- antiporter ClcA